MILTQPPAAEPLALADLKAFLRVEGSEEDGLIQSVAAAARAHLEATTGRAFVSQGWRIGRDAWPANGRLALPIGPVASLDAVTVETTDGAVSVPLDRFRLDGAAVPPRLAWQPGSVPSPAMPLAGIAIDVTAGFGSPAEVPPAIVQAIRLLAAYWFDNRSLVTVGHEVAVMPRTVSDLVSPFLARRLA